MNDVCIRILKSPAPKSVMTLALSSKYACAICYNDCHQRIHFDGGDKGIASTTSSEAPIVLIERGLACMPLHCYNIISYAFVT